MHNAQQAEEDLRGLGLEERAAAALAHTADAMIADISEHMDGGETCDHSITRVDATMVELLDGGRHLEVTARCEKCRHRFRFTGRDEVNATATIATLGVELGPLDTIKQCATCSKDHDDQGDTCLACVAEARAANKEARDR